MGCCHSNPSPASSLDDSPAAAPRPYPPTANAPSLSNPTTSPSAAQHPIPTPPPFSTGSTALSTLRPNQRLRAPSPLPHSPKNVSPLRPPWTRAHLERERAAFFDTRVAGRAEVWGLLRIVCELLQRGDVAQAQGIFDAGGLTCPTGRVARGRSGRWRDRGRDDGGAGSNGAGGRRRNGKGEKGGVFDERGELYEIPEWVVKDPDDLVDEEDEEDDDGHGIGDEGEKLGVGAGSDEDEEGEEDLHGLQVMQRRELKGKGRAVDLGEEVKVRCRLSHSAEDVEVVIRSAQTVGVLKAQIQERIGKRQLRLVYLGRVLDEKKTLEVQGWKRGHVVNAMIWD